MITLCLCSVTKCSGTHTFSINLIQPLPPDDHNVKRTWWKATINSAHLSDLVFWCIRCRSYFGLQDERYLYLVICCQGLAVYWKNESKNLAVAHTKAKLRQDVIIWRFVALVPLYPLILSSLVLPGKTICSASPCYGWAVAKSLVLSHLPIPPQ